MSFCRHVWGSFCQWHIACSFDVTLFMACNQLSTIYRTTYSGYHSRWNSIGLAQDVMTSLVQCVGVFLCMSRTSVFFAASSLYYLSVSLLMLLSSLPPHRLALLTLCPFSSYHSSSCRKLISMTWRAWAPPHTHAFCLSVSRLVLLFLCPICWPRVFYWAFRVWYTSLGLTGINWLCQYVIPRFYSIVK